MSSAREFVGKRTDFFRSNPWHQYQVKYPVHHYILLINSLINESSSTDTLTLLPTFQTLISMTCCWKAEIRTSVQSLLKTLRRWMQLWQRSWKLTHYMSHTESDFNATKGYWKQSVLFWRKLKFRDFHDFEIKCF